MAARDLRTQEQIADLQFAEEERPRRNAEVVHRGGGQFDDSSRLSYREDERAA